MKHIRSYQWKDKDFSSDFKGKLYVSESDVQDVHSANYDGKKQHSGAHERIE